MPRDAEPATFADDLAFLEKYGKVTVLEGERGAKVALSAQYQGRVMTSATSPGGRSLGWIHRDFIAARKTGSAFDNFGGEDRFWLGPEGGQFGLYFPPGKEFTFDNWQTPHTLQEGTWEESAVTSASATFKTRIVVANWSKTELTVDVTRRAALVSRATAQALLHLGGPGERDGGDGRDGGDAFGAVEYVGYQTENTIRNAGTLPWVKARGLPSIWILAMYAPAEDARVVIPFERQAGKPDAPIVNDAYFGKVPADRLRVYADEGYLLFTCDGKQRGKIGLGPRRAKNVLGSYSATAKLLTIVQYSGPIATGAYVDSMWAMQKDPYAGDVVNSYNDGSPGPGKPPLGGFYEIETSSPGAALVPGSTASHVHRTFHFVGDASALDPIARRVLGVSIEAITRP